MSTNSEKALEKLKAIAIKQAQLRIDRRENALERIGPSAAKKSKRQSPQRKQTPQKRQTSQKRQTAQSYEVPQVKQVPQIQQVKQVPQVPQVKEVPQAQDLSYFKDNADLSEKEQKWCRCILHVAAKQTDKCLEDVVKNAYKTFDGKQCYNVYAVCSGKIGTSCRKCGGNYEYKNIPDAELVAYSKIKKLVIPVPYSRDIMIQRIMEWKKLYEDTLPPRRVK